MQDAIYNTYTNIPQ